MVQGVIFDMDGLLLDTERLWDSIWPVCFQQLALPLPPESFFIGGRGLSGVDFREHLRKYYPEKDILKIVEKAQTLSRRRFAQGVPVKPGAKELLEYLMEKKIPRVLASSSSHSLINQNLGNTGLTEYFCDTVSGQDVAHSKPNPEIFLLAAERIHADIHRCLVLEDSFNGVRAGHAAGAITIMVPDLAQPDREIQKIYDHCCKDLFQVKRMLEEGQI